MDLYFYLFLSIGLMDSIIISKVESLTKETKTQQKKQKRLRLLLTKNYDEKWGEGPQQK
jgi:hypothetical protein